MDDVWVWNPPLPLSTGHSQKKKKADEKEMDDVWVWKRKEQMCGDRCLKSRWAVTNEKERMKREKITEIMGGERKAD